jgi:hypothetical protein
MKLLDRRWIRAMRRRLLAEVKASKVLRARRREACPSVLHRHFQPPPSTLRAAFFIGWLIFGWVSAQKGAALRLLPFWAASALWIRWAMLGQFPATVRQVAHLPFGAAAYFRRLWRIDGERTAWFGTEMWWVLGAWLSAHGDGGFGWLSALPLAAFAAAGTFALGAVLAALNRPAWIGLILAGAVIGGAASFVGAKFFPAQAAWLFDRAHEMSLWLTPGGWMVQAVSALHARHFGLCAAFLGATGAVTATLPLSRLRLKALTCAGEETPRDLTDAVAFREDEDDLLDPAPTPEPASETALSEETAQAAEERLRAGTLISPSPLHDPLAAWLHRRLTPRRQIIFAALTGGSSPWTLRWQRAMRFAVVGLGAIFLLRWIFPDVQTPVFFLWIALLHLRLPIFGGNWIALSGCASASRTIPPYALLPVRDRELRWVMFLANSLRFAVLAPVLSLATGAGAALIGGSFDGSALRSAALVLLLWLAQPVALALQFAHTSHLRGWLAFLILTLVIVLGGSAALLAFGLLLDGDALTGSGRFTQIAMFLGGILAALHLLSAFYCWRHARGRIDLVR